MHTRECALARGSWVNLTLEKHNIVVNGDKVSSAKCICNRQIHWIKYLIINTLHADGLALFDDRIPAVRITAHVTPHIWRGAVLGRITEPIFYSIIDIEARPLADPMFIFSNGCFSQANICVRFKFWLADNALSGDLACLGSLHNLTLKTSN